MLHPPSALSSYMCVPIHLYKGAGGEVEISSRRGGLLQRCPGQIWQRSPTARRPGTYNPNKRGERKAEVDTATSTAVLSGWKTSPGKVPVKQLVGYTNVLPPP